MESQVNIEDQKPLQIELKSKINYWMISTIVLSLVLILGGVYTYGLNRQIQKINEIKSIQTNLPVPTKSASTNICKEIPNIAGYQYCDDQIVPHISSYIITPTGQQIKNVSKYTVSPTIEWIFVVRWPDYFVTEKGAMAPGENALTMVDVANSKEYELFSQIYFPNYMDPESWSLSGNGIVFTAGGANTPNILRNPNMFAVVYCTTTCKVLAKNAGPAGIGGDPAYFKDGKVNYTDMDGKDIKISFNY